MKILKIKIKNFLQKTNIFYHFSTPISIYKESKLIVFRKTKGSVIRWIPGPNIRFYPPPKNYDNKKKELLLCLLSKCIIDPYITFAIIKS